MRFDFSDEEMEAGYVGDFLSLEDKFDLMLYISLLDEANTRTRDVPDGLTELGLGRNPSNTRVFVIWYSTDPEDKSAFVTNFGFETEDGDELVSAIDRWQKSGRCFASFNLATEPEPPFDLWLPPVRNREQFAEIQSDVIKLMEMFKQYYIDRQAAEIAASIKEEKDSKSTGHAS